MPGLLFVPMYVLSRDRLLYSRDIKEKDKGALGDAGAPFCPNVCVIQGPAPL